MRKFIFDVDGTLTPSRGVIDNDFRTWFMTYMDDPEIEVYLATGSDRPKTVEQLGEYFMKLPVRTYHCSGNDVWEGDKQIRSHDWTPDKDVIDYLNNKLDESLYPTRTGNHIEIRTGVLNFSVVGRGASQVQRASYVDWDSKYNERCYIALEFHKRFPELEAHVGGETGLDIHPIGYDKSQIACDFSSDDQLIFFGDAIYNGGNDYHLARSIDQLGGTVYSVANWQQTWNKLKEIV